jgi:phage protein D
MATVDLAKKYLNFLAPTTQILVNKQNIVEKYRADISFATVEDNAGSKGKFTFSIQDPQSALMKTTLFDFNKTVQIRMGYANKIETVITGKITSVKSIFPANGSPQIEVSGEANKVNAAPQPAVDPATYLLVYGKTIYGFTSTAIAEEKAGAARASPAKAPSSNVNCSAECVGLPDIKPESTIALAGLAAKFNQTYSVKTVQHTLDCSGFRTNFEAKMQPKTVRTQTKSGRVF